MPARSRSRKLAIGAVAAVVVILLVCRPGLQRPRALRPRRHPRSEMSDAQREDAVAPRLDPLLQEPVRLSVLSALAPAAYIEFSTLLRQVGVSKSALSKHVSALTDAGVVVVTNSPTDQRARRVALTEGGRESVDAYLRRLEEIVRSARGQGR